MGTEGNGEERQATGGRGEGEGGTGFGVWRTDTTGGGVTHGSGAGRRRRFSGRKAGRKVKLTRPVKKSRRHQESRLLHRPGCRAPGLCVWGGEGRGGEGQGGGRSTVTGRALMGSLGWHLAPPRSRQEAF